MKIHKNRILIIGSGNIFKKHLHTINILKNSFEIAGIVEKNPTKFETLKIKFNCGIFKDLDLAIKSCEFELGCILTDSGSHAKIALKLLNLFEYKNRIKTSFNCLRIGFFKIFHKN